jgi:hypothetical protein
MANDILSAYPSLISNQAVTSPDETNLRKNLMSAYLKQLQGQSVIAPIAQAVDFLGGSYRGGKNAPVGTLSAMTQNPVMKQTANILGWMGKNNNSNINPLQMARFTASQEEKEKRRAEREEKAKIKQQENIADLSETIFKDLTVRDAAKQAASSLALSRLEGNLLIDRAMAQRFILDAVGEKRKSDPDVKAMEASGSISQYIEKSYTRLAEGKMPEREKKVFETRIKKLAEIAIDSYTTLAGKYLPTATLTGMSETQFEKMLKDSLRGMSGDFGSKKLKTKSMSELVDKKLNNIKKETKKKQFSDKDLDAILYGE